MNVSHNFYFLGFEIYIFSQSHTLAPCAGSTSKMARRAHIGGARNGMDGQVLFTSIRRLDRS